MAKNQNRRNYLVVLLFAAMLAALAIILTRYCSINIGNGYRIGIGRLPIILASIWLGPVAGAMAGSAADIIGALISTGWTPLLTVPAAIAGVLPYVFARFLGLERRRNEAQKGKAAAAVAVNVIVTEFLTSGILMSVLLAFMFPSYQNGFEVFLGIRCVIATVTGAAEAVLVYVLYMNKPLNSMILKYTRERL